MFRYFQSADSNDLRRAYRKLSLTLHPDKNKEPDAEVKFRQVKSLLVTNKKIISRKLFSGFPEVS